ncbi:MAG: alpha/beta hydrolase [Parachlamydiales bacterium]
MGLRFGSASLSRKWRFLAGAAPGLIGAAAVRYFPYTAKTTVDVPVIQVTPKGKGCMEQSTLARIGEKLAFPAAVPLFPGIFLKAPYVNGENIAIESPRYRGSNATHLLRGVRLTAQNPRAEKHVAILFCGNAASSLDMADIADHYLDRGIHVQMVDVRGFGDSEGFPTAQGTHLDVEAIVEAAHQWGGKKFYFHGISLGAHLSAVGARYTAEHYGPDSVGACILEQPFGELQGAVKSIPLFAPFAGIAQWLYPYDNPAVVGGLVTRGPSLVARIRIFRGTQDSLMNPHGIHIGSHKPELDLNAEAIFQAISQVAKVERESLIRDEFGAGHCCPAPSNLWVDLLTQ